MSAWFPLPAPPAVAVFGAVLLLKACPVDDEIGEEGPDEPVAELAEATPEPTPTPVPGIDEADLVPYPVDHPAFAAATGLRTALLAVDADDLQGALGQLDAVDLNGGFAPGLAAWTRGRALRGLGRTDEAEAAWAAVPDTSRWWPEAALDRASLKLDSGDLEGVLTLLGESGPPQANEGTPSRPDQIVRAEILRSRALRIRDAEGDCDAAYGACKRVWVSAPTSSEAWTAADEGMKALDARVSAELKPGLAEKVSRAGVLAGDHANDSIVALLDSERAGLKAADPTVGCEGSFQLGRAWHKKRDYKRSTELLGWVGDHCDDPAVGVKAAYLHSQGLERRGLRDEAIASWTGLADRYPEHRFADDGLYHAGQLHLDAGRRDDAHAIFLSMPDRFPEGDMVDDALWGMAWSEIAGERWAQARPWLEQLALGENDTRARARVLRGRYWLARARMELGESDEALEGWRTLAQDAPLHWYGILAMWRLHDQSPELAAQAAAVVQDARKELARGPGERERWIADPAFLNHPSLTLGVELLRGGLKAEAAEEIKLALGRDVQDTWDLDTLVLASHLLLRADDPYAGHNLLRMAFRRTWPSSEADNRVLFEHGYPPAYSELIEKVTTDYDWDPLLFQGLVREESAFASSIRSWAGAMGLSQLMWPTAKGTAKRMGIKGLKRTDLSDPETNLSIGSTYMQGLVKRWKGHLPLAVASYNAGPGAVNKWVKARGHLELDAWVETIPYDETRGYVKRVTTSWQIYHSLYAEGRPVVPLRVGPVADAIAGDDPDPAW
jgi:soluble lytic murein transglycosylase